MARPNLVFVFADQMRFNAAGFAGTPGMRTPHLDRLASQSVNCTNAVAGVPVCTPWRACMLTGQYPLTHGLFMNDARLPTDRPTFGTVLKEAGYRTGYVGKWHLDGRNRGGWTPPGPRRQGFDFWAVGNCSHDYMKSLYYRDDPTPLYWEGYDAIAQTDLFLEFLKDAGSAPFAGFLSWGPPHNPYGAVPDRYKTLYDPAALYIPPNCPNPNREDIRGYYAHVSALDEQVGRILAALEAQGKLDETVFVFTSDHGDMLGSQGEQRKQRPWEESIHVPLLIRTPGGQGRAEPCLINAWDLMPTLLSFLGLSVPGTCQGLDLSAALRGASFARPTATLAACLVAFSEFRGPEWRAARTETHTYVRSRLGPWLLYDNVLDPFQQTNLVNRPEAAEVQRRLDAELNGLLARFGDRFEDPDELCARFGYMRDPKGGHLGYIHELGVEA